MAKCGTVSNSSGSITPDNKQEVETTPSAKHLTHFLTMICLLSDIKKELKIMNRQFEIITDEDEECLK